MQSVRMGLNNNKKIRGENKDGSKRRGIVRIRMEKMLQ